MEQVDFFFFLITQVCFSHTKFKMSIRYLGGDIKEESRNMSQVEDKKEIKTEESHQLLGGISSQSIG